MAKIFRRYESTIYGNYRKAYLIDGALTGAVMSAVMLLRDMLDKSPMSSPENYVTELVLTIAIFWSCYQYRRQLPDGKVTLKELMLLGLGIGVVSAVVYGLWTWLRCGVLDTTLVSHYNQQRISMMEPAESSAEAKVAVELVSRYTAGDWAFIGAFRSAVMSIIITFFASIIFRTEKGAVRQRKNRQQ